MEKKKEGKSLVTVIVILTILLVCALGSTAYFYLESEKTSAKETVVSKNDKAGVNSSATKETDTIIQFDGTKTLNSSRKDYTLACQGSAGIYVTVDSTQQELTFSYNPSKVQDFYSLRWSTTIDTTETHKISFTKKIIDVFFGGMGQDMSGDTLFILLEDGTVEYIPLVHVFNSEHETMSSFGTITGVTDVTKFVMAENNGGTSVTTLAIKSDGTFYDLWYALKDTGNY